MSRRLHVQWPGSMITVMFVPLRFIRFDPDAPWTRMKVTW